MTLSKRQRSASPLLHPRLLRQPSPITIRSSQGRLLSWFLLGFGLTSALVAVVWFEVVNWPLSTVTLRTASADVFEANDHPKTDKLSVKGYGTPRLAFQNSTGAINDPLPLGIILSDSSGGETLVLSDLAEGTKLSAGTDLGPTRWSVPGRDLDKAFIAAPENFSGSMQVTAKLYSSGNLVLETKSIRFEWNQGRDSTLKSQRTNFGSRN
jgi:hypothetical protein